ncbi:MAG: branched-chain amino acid ABC transporter substrate-binding protein, partial [Colwellia sp.]|nr:branched-chain amino acid ABC transporter substrate-binding protein [Colwellia sp.]
MFVQPRAMIKKYGLKSATMCLWLFCCHAFSSPIMLNISYVKLVQQQPHTLSKILKKPDDSGYSGAKLAINDSN